MTDEENDYETLWIRAEYETMGWDRGSKPERNLELDKTGTTLVVKRLSINP